MNDGRAVILGEGGVDINKLVRRDIVYICLASLFLFLVCPVVGQISFNPTKSTTTITSEGYNVVISSSGIKMTIRGKDICFYRPYKTYKQYTKQIDKNKFEIGLTFSVKPSTNMFEFQVDGYENFEFVKQVGGLDLFGKPTVFDPPEAEGGYAIMSKSNEIGKTGQVAIIYRPKLIDSNKAESPCDITYENGKLRVNCDKDWLKTATYPVILDPTLGTTTIGSGGGTSSHIYVLAGKLGTMPEDGIVTSITACMWSKTIENCYVIFALYLNGGAGLPVNLIAGSATAPFLCPKGSKPTLPEQWLNASMSASLTSGSVIWAVYSISEYTDGDGQIAKIDSDGWGAYGPPGGGDPYHTFPQSTCQASVALGWKLSVYITYTTGGGGVAPNPKKKTLGVIYVE